MCVQASTGSILVVVETLVACIITGSTMTNSELSFCQWTLSECWPFRHFGGLPPQKKRGGGERGKRKKAVCLLVGGGCKQCKSLARGAGLGRSRGGSSAGRVIGCSSPWWSWERCCGSGHLFCRWNDGIIFSSVEDYSSKQLHSTTFAVIFPIEGQATTHGVIYKMLLAWQPFLPIHFWSCHPLETSKFISPHIYIFLLYLLHSLNGGWECLMSLPPVWNLRAVTWFHSAISCIYFLPSPVSLSVFFLSAGPLFWTLSRKFCNIFC